MLGFLLTTYLFYSYLEVSCLLWPSCSSCRDRRKFVILIAEGEQPSCGWTWCSKQLFQLYIFYCVCFVHLPTYAHAYLLYRTRHLWHVTHPQIGVLYFLQYVPWGKKNNVHRLGHGMCNPLICSVSKSFQYTESPTSKFAVFVLVWDYCESLTPIQMCKCWIFNFFFNIGGEIPA